MTSLLGKMARTASLGGTFALCLMLMAVPALAQESEPSPADSATGWVFRWLNFAIVFSAIVYVAVKKGAPYFRKQADEISQKIAEGARAREAAEKVRREAQVKLAGIEKEIARMREESKRDAAVETERVRELARKDAEAIERSALAEIAAAERATRLALKAAAARLAVEQATAALRGRVAADADEKLFGDFVTGIKGSVN